MKSCQLCGTCSWGVVSPAIDPFNRDSAQVYLVGRDLSWYRRCDGCGSLAAQANLEDDSRQDPVLTSVFPDPTLRSVTAVIEGFKQGLPQPETRTERLVRDLIKTDWHEPLTAQALVGFARKIEQELDAPSIPAEYPSYADLAWFGSNERHFLTRADLQEWLIHGLGHAKEAMCAEQVPAVFSVNRLAFLFINWLERGAPTE